VTSDERSFYWRLTAVRTSIFSRLYGLDARARARRRSPEGDGHGSVATQFMSYSTGMKQLAIAGAASRPPVLCMDEPTRSLDPIAAKHLRAS